MDDARVSTSPMPAKTRKTGKGKDQEQPSGTHGQLPEVKSEHHGQHSIRRGDGQRLKQYWWKPGQSANPGGRAPGLRARVREATRDGQDVIDLLVRVVQSDKEATRDRISASVLLLDRGWGKATQPVEVGRHRSERRLAVLEAISRLPQDVVSQVCAVLALSQGQDSLPDDVGGSSESAGNSAPGKDIL